MVTAELESGIFGIFSSLAHVVIIAVVPLHSPIYPVEHQEYQNLCC
jgi:hypothetical protein